MVVYKYPLKNAKYQWLTLPKGAEILCVKKQGKSPVLYAKVDPLEGLENKTIITALTGEDLPDNVEYIDTIMFQEGCYVEHYFVEK